MIVFKRCRISTGVAKTGVIRINARVRISNCKSDSSDAPRYWLFCKIYTLCKCNTRAHRNINSFPFFVSHYFNTIYYEGKHRSSHLLFAHSFVSSTHCSVYKTEGEMRSVTRFIGRSWGYSFRISGHLVLPCLRNRWTSRRCTSLLTKSALTRRWRFPPRRSIVISGSALFKRDFDRGCQLSRTTCAAGCFDFV